MINTGRVHRELRSTASDEVLELFRRTYSPGNHSLPIGGYRAEVVQTSAGCLCLVVQERTDLPLLTVAVAEDKEAADQLWPDLVRYFAAFGSSLDTETDLTNRPASEPWYATLSMFATPDDWLWLSDFSRAFAWGWIEHRQREVLWDPCPSHFPGWPHASMSGWKA